MARYNQKRKASGGPVFRKFKRARPMRRRRYAKKQSQWTSQSSYGQGIGMRGRRQSRRAWRRQTWISSNAQTHYRSNNSSTTAINTSGAPTSMSTTIIASRRLSGQNFWTALGGAVNPDGGAIPTFATNTDFTVRGGMFGLRVGNSPDSADTDKDALSVIVYLIRTTKAWNSTSVTANVTTGWDPTLVQDFQTNIGKVVLRKNYLLNEGESFTIERRMGLSKIDQTEYANSISEYVWLILAGTTTAFTTKALVATAYYNMSFVGDAV